MLVASAACPSRSAERPRLDPCEAAVASSASAEVAGFLHRALRSLGDPVCPGAAEARARLLDRLGRDREALAAYRALPSEPRHADRIAEIERRPRLDPASMQAIGAADRREAALLYREGAGLRAAGRHDDAIVALRQSYARWPHPLTIVQIGLAHRAAGRAVEAQVSFERALAIAEVMSGEIAAPRWTPRHAGSIDVMTFDPSGRLLATAGADGQVLLWEPVTGQLLRVLATDAAVRGLAFSADADRVIALYEDRVVSIGVDDGAIARDVRLHADRAVLGPTGAVAYADDAGQLWSLAPDAATGTAFAAAESETESLGFSADGTRLVQVTADELVVWSVSDGARVAGLPRGENDFDVALDATGTAVIVAGHEGFERIEVATSARSPMPGTAALSPLHFDLPAPDRLLADGGDGYELWDLSARRLLRAGGPGFAVTAAALHPRGDELAVASSEGEIRIYDVGSGKAAHTVGGDTWGINDVSFDAAGQRLLVASDDGSVKLWDLRASGKLPSIWAHRGWVVFARISDDGTRVVTGGKDQRVHIWDMVQRKRVRTLAAGIPGKGNSAVDASRDGRAVVATFQGYLGRASGWVVAMQPLDGGPGPVFTAPHMIEHLVDIGWGGSKPRPLPIDRPPRTVTLSPDGTRLALGTDEGAGGARVVVIEIASGRKVSTVTGATDNITACAFTPDGTRLAIASAAAADGIIVARVDTGGRLAVLPTRARDHVVELAFSPDGARLVAVGRDHAVRIFDVAAERALHTLTAHEAVVTGVAFAPSGTLFATSSKDRSVRLWDAATAELRVTLRPTRRGDWIAVTPDGRVDGSPGGADLITFEVGPYRLPGFVGWDRARDSGLLERIGADARR